MYKDLMLRLLYAVFNVGGNAEPETKAGEEFSMKALAMAEILGNAADDGVNSRKGALAAAALFAEVFSQSDPIVYAEQEIKRGLCGDRHEWDIGR